LNKEKPNNNVEDKLSKEIVISGNKVWIERERDLMKITNENTPVDFIRELPTL